MSEDYQRVLWELSSLRRQNAEMFKVGTVHEVKGTKLRMVLGKDKEGKDVLSPWLNTSNMRGGAREQRFYKKGQTLQIISPNGDISQGSIAPYAPNKDFETPEHADGSGQNEETYQLEDYRTKQTKDGHDQWLQPDQKQQGGSSQQKKGHTGGASAAIKSRMHKDGGHTLRVGKDSRVASHKNGAKIRFQNEWVVVTKGKIIMSQPPIIKRDPIPNDDG